MGEVGESGHGRQIVRERALLDHLPRENPDRRDRGIAGHGKIAGGALDLESSEGCVKGHRGNHHDVLRVHEWGPDDHGDCARGDRILAGGEIGRSGARRAALVFKGHEAGTSQRRTLLTVPLGTQDVSCEQRIGVASRPFPDMALRVSMVKAARNGYAAGAFAVELHAPCLGRHVHDVFPVRRPVSDVRAGAGRAGRRGRAVHGRRAAARIGQRLIVNEDARDGTKL